MGTKRMFYGGNFAAQDRVAIRSILEAGFSPSDAYTTFKMSTRGRHCVERHGVHFEKYIVEIIRRAAIYKSRVESSLGRKQCLDFLRNLLSAGAVRSTAVEREAKAAGIDIRKLKKYKHDLGITSGKREGRFYWVPPNEWTHV
jgi:hypothetical protein